VEPLLTNADRINKLREVFNKASEGKSKLSVNDFSESSGSTLRWEPCVGAALRCAVRNQ
jgi:hypothetical protein